MSLLISGARVYTADLAAPWAEAILIDENRLTHVGSEQEARDRATGSVEEVHIPGGLAVPGINDSHIHMSWGAHALTILNLEDVTNARDLQTNLRKFAAAHPDHPWIEGFGLRYEPMMALSDPPTSVFDAAIADRPVFIRAFDYHSAWCNTKALQLAHIERGADIPPPNEVVVDPATGLATGHLIERGAHSLVADLIPEPTEHELLVQLRTSMAHVNRFGITSVQNMHGDAVELARYERLRSDGDATVRAAHYLSFRPDMPQDTLDTFAELAQRYSDTWNRVAGIKFFLDGVVQSKTAMMLEPYADGSGDTGVPDMDLDTFFEVVLEANRLGLNVATHAIGDGAVRAVLDTYEYASRLYPTRDRRNRIEHVEVSTPTDILRFRPLGITASMQPLHAVPTSPDPRNDPWVTMLGARREPLAFPWRTLSQERAMLAFGSDWPVVTCDTRAGLRAAVTRTGPNGFPRGGWQPQQCVTLAEALDAYTREAAFAEGQEFQKGMLSSGKLADIAVFAQDLFELPPQQWTDVEIAITILDGKVVHRTLY